MSATKIKKISLLETVMLILEGELANITLTVSKNGTFVIVRRKDDFLTHTIYISDSCRLSGGASKRAVTPMEGIREATCCGINELHLFMQNLEEEDAEASFDDPLESLFKKALEHFTYS